MALYKYVKADNSPKKKLVNYFSLVSLTIGALLLFWSFYPIVSLKFGIVNFPEKNLQYNYTGGASEFGAGF